MRIIVGSTSTSIPIPPVIAITLNTKVSMPLTFANYSFINYVLKSNIHCSLTTVSAHLFPRGLEIGHKQFKTQFSGS